MMPIFSPGEEVASLRAGWFCLNKAVLGRVNRNVLCVYYMLGCGGSSVTRAACSTA